MKNRPNIGGILLVDKQAGSTSFHLVSILRRLTGIQKIGHAGTLDPFATGVMVMLVGQEYTRKSDQFLNSDKQYLATLHLGVITDTYDIEGQVTKTTDKIPTLQEVEKALEQFQGEIFQTPPMFSAKKIQGKKLYELARKGIEVERQPVKVTLQTTLIKYEYPKLELLVNCSKGTYIRSLAFDLGNLLETGAHLSHLTRTKSGPFTLSECIHQSKLIDTDITQFLKTGV
jgi:tRNA pseudouridine55 synthase